MRIGIFLPNWIGDVVMATPALRAVRAHFGGQAHVVGILRPYVQPVLAGTRWLDEYLVYDRHSLSGVRSLVSQLRKQRFDSLLLLTNSLSTGAFAWLSGASQRIGFAMHGRRMLLTHPLRPPRRDGKVQPHSAVDHYLDVVGALGCRTRSKVPELATTEQEEAEADGLWRQFGWEASEPVAILNTGGAYGAAKSWPAEHFSNLARRLAQQHDLRVLFLCGPAERDVVAWICQHAGHPGIKSLARQEPNIGLSKACVRRGRVMVTTDSGPRHFAAAFGVPSVTLFGPTDPRWSHNYLADSIDLQLDIACSPCARRVCPLEHHRCMRELTVDHVAAATASLLDAVDRQRAA